MLPSLPVLEDCMFQVATAPSEKKKKKLPMLILHFDLGSDRPAYVKKLSSRAYPKKTLHGTAYFHR